MSNAVKQLHTEKIYQLLRNDIVNLAILPGQKINLRELQQFYNVSGSPIREAISRLHQEGLVEYIPNVGAKVISFKPKDIIDLQELHALLDCNALELALQHESHSDIAAALLIHIESHKCGDLTGPSKFHRELYLLSHNNRLQKVWEQVEVQVELVRAMYTKKFQREGLADKGLMEHIEIYEAILAGDIQQAYRKIKEHHDSALKLLLRI